ncbi:MAG: malate dehydrogenase [Chloroflexi bacterium]|nr:malate dehydrogenase [Chloroflexota bacterium]
MRPKITIIGAGNVGATCAQGIYQKGYADVLLFDIIEGIPQGKAADLTHSGPVVCSDARIAGTNKFADTANSDIVIITIKGTPPPLKEGETRPQLSGRAIGIYNNSNAIKETVEKIVMYSPNCVIIMVTNPVDVMAYYALQVSRFPKNRVMGISGILDTSRLRSFIAADLNVSVQDVSTCIIGQHGEAMVPLPRLTTIGGVPIIDIMSKEKVDALMERAKRGAGEVSKHIKNAIPFYAPSAAIAEMAEAIILDKKRILPVSAYLEGEYDMKDIYLDVPSKIGRNGVEQVLEIKLTPDEMELLKKSALSVREQLDVLKQLT